MPVLSDYLNFGCGAEMGIYCDPLAIPGPDLWKSVSFELPMTLNLYNYYSVDNIENIFKQYYDLNNSLRYCNGTYYKFENDNFKDLIDSVFDYCYTKSNGSLKDEDFKLFRIQNNFVRIVEKIKNSK